jgi:hypothetical protein
MADGRDVTRLTTGESVVVRSHEKQLPASAGNVIWNVCPTVTSTGAVGSLNRSTSWPAFWAGAVDAVVDDGEAAAGAGADDEVSSLDEHPAATPPRSAAAATTSTARRRNRSAGVCKDMGPT